MTLKLNESLQMYATMYFVAIICLLKITAGDIIVQTNTGPIQGVTALSGVHSFLGVPYAEPPVGDLRFAKPVSKKPWTHILDASKFSPPCPQVQLDIQYDFLPDLTNMTEDCLYLNIWSPRFTANEALKPVIIYFHAGGFTSGSSSMDAYDGRNLAKRGNVVVVTLNHRLGPFGFLLAYIDEAAGNMGMYDQITAIEWVKDNAVLFGGDPKNIVLMGVSAGGTSVMAHMVSPISKTLFQKAIIHSGGISLNYFFDNNTRVFDSSKKIASIVGCTNETVTLQNKPHAVVNCLKRSSVESLLKAERILLKLTPIIFFPATGDKFLPQPGIDYIREGKFRKDIPVLAGFNRNEGTIFISMATPEYFGVCGKNKIETFPKYLANAFARAALSLSGISNFTEILNYYLSLAKNRTSQEYINMLANITGDYAVACNTLFPIDFFSLRGNSVYFYVFGFRPYSASTAEWMGTTHLDDQQYIFGNPINRNFSEEEVEVSNRFMDRWSNFARTGNPNIPGEISWLPYSYQNPLYLSIDQEKENIRMNPIDRCDVWRKHLGSVIDSDIITFFEKLD